MTDSHTQNESLLHVCLPDKQPVLRTVPMPSDTNYAGDIFGGWIMSQVDMAEAYRPFDERTVEWSLSRLTPLFSNNRYL